MILTQYIFNFSTYIFLQRSYLDKTISLHLNKNRKVSGTLRGYDQYMNVVLSDSVDESTNTKGSKAEDMGMIVRDVLYKFLFVLSLATVAFFCRFHT